MNTYSKVNCFFKETSKQTHKSQPLLPFEFLRMEEIPQTPPTVTTMLNVTVWICGLPTLLKALQLSMMGPPRWLSHMLLECNLGKEREGNGDTDDFQILKFILGLRNVSSYVLFNQPF